MKSLVQLQEEYEEAWFALMMRRVGELIAKESFEENERLNNDPSAQVPKRIDRRCRWTIRKHFWKRRLSRMSDTVRRRKKRFHGR